MTTAELIPAWISAIAAAAGVLVAGAAIVFAAVQVRQTARQMRRTAAASAQDSEDRTRPYVAADIVPGLHGPPVFDIVVMNHGRTAARNVTLDLEGGFGPQCEGDEIGPALGRMFASGFDLAPGARRRVIWRAGRDEATGRSEPHGAPVTGLVQLNYQWDPGDERPVRSYSEQMSYDLTEYPKLTPSPTRGTTHGSRGSRDTILVAQNTVEALGAIAQHVGEIRR